MATISMGDLKKGVRLELDGNPYKVVDFQHVKPGKGAAFVRCKIKKKVLNEKSIKDISYFNVNFYDGSC